MLPRYNEDRKLILMCGKLYNLWNGCIESMSNVAEKKLGDEEMILV